MLFHKFQRHRKKVFLVSFCYLLLFSAILLYDSVPDEIYLADGETGQMHFDVPVTLNKEESVPVLGVNTGSVKGADISRDYNMMCKFLNVIPVKEVLVHEVEKEYVMPSGLPIGIYTKTKGVLIIGTGKVTAADGLNYEPAEQIVKGGDYITAVNGVSISEKEDLIRIVDECGGNDVILGILRDGKSIELKIHPAALEDGSYKLGIWVRDDMAGVGTLTYIKQDLDYGALGHPVSDGDTGSTIRLAEGMVYNTDIVGVVRGKGGSPGELTGVINYKEENCLGSIKENTKTGIYGTLNRVPEEMEEAFVEVGMKQEIERGEAYILSSLDGSMRQYKIEIDEVDFTNKEENKGILFHVTDELLLNETGGIVQGM